MFISVKFLHEILGVHERIARFFVDRKVPQDNIFWSKRLLYVGRGNGFVNIPVYFDILFRVGIPIEVLLEEAHIQFMEQVMHFAIQAEKKEISEREQIEKISGILQDRLSNYGFHEELMSYLDQDKLLPKGRLGITPPALNRADVFLFILCDIPIDAVQLTQAIRYWYALHPTYLLMDDIHDYKDDKEKDEENAILELGDGAAGFEAAFQIIEQNIAVLNAINPALADSLQSQLTDLHELVV